VKKAKRTEVKAVGPYPVLRADVVKFLRGWPALSLTEDDLSELTRIAIDPACLLRGDNMPRIFAAKYYLEPDFVPAFLTFIRRLWFKASRQARLRAYLATSRPWFLSHGKVEHRVDKELADSYEAKSGEHVKIHDVEAARKDLSRRVRDGLRAKLPTPKNRVKV
jgi:hypothetical protein